MPKLSKSDDVCRISSKQSVVFLRHCLQEPLDKSILLKRSVHALPFCRKLHCYRRVSSCSYSV